jgi:DNA-binding HxlR family transcriptional regulator
MSSWGIIDVISRKWALLIIAVIGNKYKVRFREIKKELGGISPKSLRDRLRELEEAGLVKKKVFTEIPLKVEYSLTEDGLELRNLIKPL